MQFDYAINSIVKIKLMMDLIILVNCMLLFCIVLFYITQVYANRALGCM